MQQITVVELFSGIGGLSYGFAKNNKFKILLANDIELDMVKAYKLNHPKINTLQADIKNLNKDVFKNYFDCNVDVIIGGPPCQSYSTLGKRQNDDRAKLFLEYARVINILKPKLFMFENVCGVLSMDNGNVFNNIKTTFQELGYKLSYKILNAVNFGVPQNRERVILVGVKNNINFNFPTETHGKDNNKKIVTLAEAIGDLEQIKSGETGLKFIKKADNEFLNFVRTTNVLTEHKSPLNNKKLIEIMQTLKDGEDKNSLPEHLKPSSGYNNTYAKLWWDKPSTTITRNFACPSSSRCIHPRDSRALSIREGARLQSFPDDYKFYGSDGTKRLQIGNAVPPLLSIALAREVEKAFQFYHTYDETELNFDAIEQNQKVD
ncbi:DNA cytosine methyltransferase [Campylobacter sp. MG1]|uniref:DNA cytosine methyltransferase n=1 Tax=Campylobacter sp. MG1 TaxID=2976332 RepID=UPI00226C777E|nr:DNA cytosine methyltransferase [Campylobacter sp. MG1]